MCGTVDGTRSNVSIDGDGQRLSGANDFGNTNAQTKWDCGAQTAASRPSPRFETRGAAAAVMRDRGDNLLGGVSRERSRKLRLFGNFLFGPFFHRSGDIDV